MAAEIIGGLVLIIISSILIKITYPEKWLKKAREKVQEEGPDIEEEFDWKKRIKSKKGWRMVGNSFVNEWKMVWEEILIGFTIAMIAPFVAAMTFIGSMGNIPLATVLNTNGVLFAGIMGFIYSDLMVPSLVAVNAKYYGKKVALYIAGIMYISIVLTALILNGFFGMLGVLPESNKVVSEVARFKIDYTFYLNILFVLMAGWLIYLKKQYMKIHKTDSHDMSSNTSLKRKTAYLFAIIIFGGLLVNIFI